LERAGQGLAIDSVLALALADRLDSATCDPHCSKKKELFSVTGGQENAVVNLKTFHGGPDTT
jgi:hypothetical protein